MTVGDQTVRVVYITANDTLFYNSNCGEPGLDLESQFLYGRISNAFRHKF
jgi:hypothetical protein